jgi:hypothetical protein
LPKDLIYLSFGGRYRYNHRFKPGVLPPRLKTLIMQCASIYQPFEPGSLPSSLEELIFDGSAVQHISPGILPSKLRELKCNFHNVSELSSLPATLKKLTMVGKFNHPTPLSAFPAGLEDLDMQWFDYYDVKLQPNVFPSTLRRLIFSNYYNHPLQPHILPNSLEFLKIGSRLSLHTIGSGILSVGLSVLCFNGSFEELLPVHSYPSSLRALCLGEYNFKLTSGMFPSTLESLMFHREFNQTLDSNVFPSSLKELYLGDDYDVLIDDNILPLSLKKLVLPKDYAHPLPTIHSRCAILRQNFESALPAEVRNTFFSSNLQR